nr:SdpI family protein [Rhodococcus sp. (in: high G+C Gram-positive bacteria)]
MIVVSILLFVLALVVGSVAAMSLTGKLPRNRWAGVRTAESMRDDETFTMANKVAGPTNAAAALLLLVGGAAGLMLTGVFSVVAVVVCLVAAFVTAGIGGSIGARAAAAAKPAEEAGGCGHSCISCSLKDACAPS